VVADGLGHTILVWLSGVPSSHSRETPCWADDEAPERRIETVY
jgi:hypothetical protein